MRAIYINSKEKKAEVIETPDNLQNYRRLLDCDMIDFVTLGNGHDVIIDDEGLFCAESFFSVNGSVLMAGNGLIVGIDEDRCIDCTLNLNDLQIRYFNKTEALAELQYHESIDNHSITIE